MKKYYKFGLIALVILLLTLFYFQFLPVITPDSTIYYQYIDILGGTEPFHNWNILRGPSLPSFLFLIVKLFGENTTALLIGFYFSYLCMLFFLIRMMSKLLKENDLHTESKWVYSLFVLFLVFNPIMIGYSHMMLTETLAPTIVVLTLYLCYKWIDIDYKNHKLKHLWYLFLFSFLLVFMWFLKQPYLPVLLCIMGIGSILKWIETKNFKFFLQKLGFIFLGSIVLALSIVGWNTFLKSQNVRFGKGTTGSFISQGFLNGITGNFYPIGDTCSCNIDYILNETSISSDLKAKIVKLSKEKEDYCEYYQIFNIYDRHGSIIGQTALIQEKKELQTKESLQFLFTQIKDNPLLVMHSYLRNYLVIGNWIAPNIENNVYAPTNILSETEGEIGNGALVAFDKRYIAWWNYFDEEARLKYIREDKNVQRMLDYDVINDPSYSLSTVVKILEPLYTVSFKLLILFLPIFFLYSFIQFIRTHYNRIYFWTTTIFASSLLHMIELVVTGQIIDRYAYLIYPMVLFGVILLLMRNKGGNKTMIKKEKTISANKKEQKIKLSVEDTKTLFVIPAYNESENIEKVLHEIKKDASFADIVVVNDCSKDRTADIVQSNHIECITMPFNVGYAMAVQTGIRYARDHGYDYVIQFDADGQHIAKEALKLLSKMQKTESDIVIGSRFLEKTGYKHPFFRKVGTKLFSFLIKIFCHKKITDPTSGFQCLNRKVIEEYAKVGNYPEFPDANLIIEMLLKGYKIEEVSTKMRLRENGQSMHGGILKPIRYMVTVIYTILFILIKNIHFERGDK